MNSKFLIAIHTQGDMSLTDNWVGALEEIIKIIKAQDKHIERENWKQVMFQDDRFALIGPDNGVLVDFGWFKDPTVDYGPETFPGRGFRFTPTPDGEPEPIQGPPKALGHTTLEEEMIKLGDL